MYILKGPQIFLENSSFERKKIDNSWQKKIVFFINDTNNIQVYTYWINFNTEVCRGKSESLQNHSQHSLLSFSNIKKMIPCYSVTCFSYKIYISMSVLTTHLFFFKLFVLIFYFILKVIVVTIKNQTQIYSKQIENPLSSINPSSFNPFIEYIHTWKICIYVVTGQLLSNVGLFVTPWTSASQAFLSFTVFQSLLKSMFTGSVIPSRNLILCYLLLLLPFQASGAFSMSCRSFSFSFSICPSNEHSWLISFMIE